MSQPKDLDKSAATSASPKRQGKLHYVDNLRSSLTALVILHHTATSYGGIGRNVYQASQFGQAASATLTGFNAINHSYFMSTFFYLAGHFSRNTLQRKSKGQFVRDRLYRLGLPTVAYTLIGAPFCLAVRDAWQGRTVGWTFLTDYWRSVRQVAGPVWFTATLLTFDLSMVALDSIRERLGRSRPGPSAAERKNEDRHVRSLPLLAALSTCSAAEFFARLYYPVGVVVPPLKIQPGNVPPYIAAYVFGSYVQDVAEVLPTAFGGSACLTAAAVSSAYLPSALLHGQTWAGGLNKAALSFAVWGNFLGYLIGSTFIHTFSRVSTAPWHWINRYAYAAFLVHMPVLTVLGVMTDKWRARPVPKTMLVGSACVALSWISGFAVAESWTSLRRLVQRNRPANAN